MLGADAGNGRWARSGSFAHEAQLCLGLLQVDVVAEPSRVDAELRALVRGPATITKTDGDWIGWRLGHARGIVLLAQRSPVAIRGVGVVVEEFEVRWVLGSESGSCGCPLAGVGCTGRRPPLRFRRRRPRPDRCDQCRRFCCCLRHQRRAYPRRPFRWPRRWPSARPPYHPSPSRQHQGQPRQRHQPWSWLRPKLPMPRHFRHFRRRPRQRSFQNSSCMHRIGRAGLLRKALEGPAARTLARGHSPPATYLFLVTTPIRPASHR